MISSLKQKVKDMATVSTPDGGSLTLPGWFLKIASVAMLVVLASGGVALTTWAQVGQNTRDITGHERRIEALEGAPTQIAVMQSQLSTLIEQNKILATEVRGLRDQLAQHMADSHNRSVRNDR